MRLLVTADPYLPVPPRRYGGIERVVAVLVEGLVRRGHRVTLVAHPDSHTSAELVPYGVPPHTGAARRARELAQVAAVLLARRSSVDVVHSFGRLAALAPILPLEVPKIQTYQRAIPWSGVARARRLAGRSLRFTACSAALARAADPRTHGIWHTVPNPVDTALYDVVPTAAPDAPLVFLGRIEAIKGVSEAVEIARRARRRLVIAGNRVDTQEGRRYFDTVVAPLVGSAMVTYAGELDDGQKNALLGQAAALLMPIQWEEPFGIVMIEALACGTPVIGLRRGSVPEVVRHGVTGFVCDSLDGAVVAVGALSRIDRVACRRDAEQRFGMTPVVEAYERVYDEAGAA